jgi:glycosyltransferase involved in cell wall biosynthesis/GT2 family glycosyltransferase
MKVVLYSEYFFPVSGGVQTNILELACGLSEWHERHPDWERIEVTVVTRTVETTEEDSSWPFHLVRGPSFAQMVRLLSNADVIHVAGPALLPMIAGLVLGKPVLVAHHGYQSVCPNGLLLLGADRTVCPGHFLAGRYGQCVRCNWGDVGPVTSSRIVLMQFPRRWLCKLASSNIAVTDHVACRIALKRTRTILHGIRDPGPAVLPQDGRVLEVGYVGRLVTEKGLPLLLKAAKRLQDAGFEFHLTLVGGGPLRQKLEDESRELGLTSRVNFAGELSGAELERAVRPLQVLVMPSVWEETAGLAAVEQMMRGQLVIASDIGGLSEVVGDAGLKFAPGDSEALYACLRRVLETPSLVMTLGSAARARATRLFQRENMIGAHVSAYLKVIRRSLTPRERVQLAAETTTRGEETEPAARIEDGNRPALSVGVLVLNYNTWELALRALNAAIALDAETAYEYVLYDDGSTIPPPSGIDRRIRVIRSRVNRGLAPALKTAFAEMKSDVVVLFDSDAYPVMPFAARVRDRFENDRALGQLGFFAQDQNGSPTESFQCEPNKWSLLLGQKLYECIPRRAPGPDNLCVITACMATRAEAYNQVGGMDEKFDWLDLDLDYSMRLRRNGWKVATDSLLKVVHEGGGTPQQQRHRLLRFYKNRWYLLRKHGLITSARTARSFILARLVLERVVLKLFGTSLYQNPEVLADKIVGRRELISYCRKQYR